MVGIGKIYGGPRKMAVWDINEVGYSSREVSSTTEGLSMYY